MLGVTNVTTSQTCAVDTKQFNLGKTKCIHAHRFVNYVPKTLPVNPLVLCLKGHIYMTLSESLRALKANGTSLLICYDVLIKTTDELHPYRDLSQVCRLSAMSIHSFKCIIY